MTFDDSEARGRAGVHALGLVVSKMRWIFREQPVPDTGIDAHIEPRTDQNRPTGKLIGCQVKSGPSYLEEQTASGFIYRGSPEHLAYWLGHSLPVIVVLHDEEANKCYWQIVNDKTAISTGKGWKVEVPRTNVIGEEAKPALARIADTGWLERSRTFTTAEKFFHRVETSPLFDYEQKLQGRQASLREMNEFLANTQEVVGVLVGRGGIGKSKLIRHWVSEASEWTVLFKKETVSVSEATEQELGGDGYLIIVDDAHRQTDIDQFLQVVRDLKRNGKRIKVLLSCRPIGVQRIDSALSRSFDPTAVTHLKELKRLGDAEVRALAEEVLGGKHAQLPYLVTVSRDTPLVTVIGGRILQRDPTLARDLPGEEDFRRAVFAKFLEDFESVSMRGPRNARSLLHLISALQPIALRTENVIARFATFLGWQSFEVSQAIDEMESAGLLVRSGRMYRIAPDMFADFLLEQAAVNRVGASNGYADAIYKSFGNEYLSHLLQNIAELDYRVVDEGRLSLLVNVWKDIRQQFGEAENYDKMQLLKGVEAAAFYQPGPVMELVKLALRLSGSKAESGEPSDALYNFSNQDVLNSLPPLLRATAYQLTYREEAVRLLWKLAATDSRRPNSYPEHAVRILKQLAAYSRYKPAEFNMDIARIITRLCSEADSFVGSVTPLDVIDELLKKEGEEHESVGRTFVISHFGLNHAVVGPIRQVCLQTLSDCLASDNARKACRAFTSLFHVIGGYLSVHPLSLEEQQWQMQERRDCLLIISNRLRAGNVPLTLAREIKAHLEQFISYGANLETNELVRAVLQELPASPALDAFDFFCSGEWDMRERATTASEIADRAQRNRQRGEEIAVAFRRQFDSVERCIEAIAGFYQSAHECDISPSGSNEFVNNLCNEPEFLSRLAEKLRTSTYAPHLALTAQVVIRRLREREGEEYLTTALAAARSADISLLRSAAVAMWGSNYDPVRTEDFRILEELANRDDRYVRETVLRALSLIGKNAAHEQEAIERILSINPGEDKNLGDELCNCFMYQRIPVQHLTDSQFHRLLGNLVELPDIDEYGISLLITWAVANKPAAVAQFLRQRIQKAWEQRSNKNWSYHIVPHPGHHVGFHGIDDPKILRELRLEILSLIETKEIIRDDLITVFWAISVIEKDTLDLLQPWIQSGDSGKFELALAVLRQAPGRIPFSDETRVLEILQEAAKLGEECLRRSIGVLVSSVHPTFFSGIANEQPPAMVELHTKADEALRRSDLHPLMKRLYESVKASAEIDLRPFPDEESDEEF